MKKKNVRVGFFEDIIMALFGVGFVAVVIIGVGCCFASSEPCSVEGCKRLVNYVDHGVGYCDKHVDLYKAAIKEREGAEIRE